MAPFLDFAVSKPANSLENLAAIRLPISRKQAVAMEFERLSLAIWLLSIDTDVVYRHSRGKVEGK